jgi:hypothetical protein
MLPHLFLFVIGPLAVLEFVIHARARIRRRR